MTFSYPPEQYFANKITLLTDQPTKHRLIKSLGIDEIVCLEFDLDFANISAKDFIKDILCRALSANQVICGYNYRFGHKAQGDSQLLNEYGAKLGFKVLEVFPVTYGEQTISSTRIRQSLREGNIGLAAQLLGRYPSYTGEITSENNLSHKLNLPIVCFETDPDLLLPKSGVYLTWCHLSDGSSYPAITSVGSNLTVTGKSITAFLPDFSNDLSNETMELQFIQYIRNITPFANTEQLRQQIAKDLTLATSLLPKYRLQEHGIMLE